MCSKHQNTMIDEIFEKFDGAFAENTIRAYRSDFDQYSKWCANMGIPPIPATADNLALYVDDLSHTCKSATIRRRVNSLGTIFKLSRNPDPSKDPEVILALKRMHRRIGRHQKQAPPLTRDHLKQLLANCTSDLRGLRNKVLLQLGYETMRRRSELCAFEFEDLDATNESQPLITLRKSKTDQEAIGVKIPISRMFYELLLVWQRTADLKGPILRCVDRHGNVGCALNSGSIGTILNDLASSGSDASKRISYSGHSFRVGRAVDLLDEGIPLEKIMLIGGWRSQSACIGYLRSQQYLL
jgi:site-specific recombinase XerD